MERIVFSLNPARTSLTIAAFVNGGLFTCVWAMPAVRVSRLRISANKVRFRKDLMMPPSYYHGQGEIFSAEPGLSSPYRLVIRLTYSRVSRYGGTLRPYFST